MEQENKFYVLKEGEEFGGFWARLGAYMIDLLPIIVVREIVLFFIGFLLLF